MNHPTVEEFLTAVDNAVAARGADYVYPTTDCLYNESPQEDVPRCLYGQVMFDLGHPVPPEFEGMGIDVVLRRMFDWYLDSPVSRAALVGQDLQDQQKPWGEAQTAMWSEYNRLTP